MIYFKKTTIKKILRQPRYCPDEITVNSKHLKYCDSRTLIDGYREIFEREIYAFNAECDSPYIVDCGSNIGLSIFYFKKIYPKSKILAFEADKNIFEMLNYNILEFNLSDVTTFNYAVWIEDGYVDFYSEGGFSGRISKEGDPFINKVPSIKFSNFIDTKIDLLKMDIEGSEVKVISSIADKLKLIDRIFIEYHSYYSEPQELNKLLEVLSDGGFRYYIKEAYVSENPFIEVKNLVGMDLQLNIFAIRR